MLKSLLPSKVKVNLLFDDIRLKSNSDNNKTNRFTKKSFFYILLVFTESNSGVLGDTPGFIQLIPSTYKSNRPFNFTGNDKFHLKADFYTRNHIQRHP